MNSNYLKFCSFILTSACLISSCSSHKEISLGGKPLPVTLKTEIESYRQAFYDNQDYAAEYRAKAKEIIFTGEHFIDNYQVLSICHRKGSPEDPYPLEVVLNLTYWKKLSTPDQKNKAVRYSISNCLSAKWSEQKMFKELYQYVNL